VSTAHEVCEHGIPMAFLYCRECSIVWHKEGEREALERLEHHRRCLDALTANEGGGKP
jgi:hypothetical protein